jgi:1-acyl-sn-glycerol-3-phosphate acyltransferase
MSLTSEGHGISREGSRQKVYNHSNYERRRRFLRFLLRTIAFTLLVKVDEIEGLSNVPKDGSAVLLMNHIAFLDPIVLIHIIPRNIIPMAKIEVYRYPVIGIFPRIWGVIPVRRQEFDRRAVQDALEVLRAGEIVLVAPEGTRNPELRRGKEGVAYLASRSGAPVIPVAIEGTQGYPTLRFSHRWREGGITVRFGKPFVYRAELQRAGREDLRKMADEAMYLLASLLSEPRRGAYSDLSRATQDTIIFR